MLRVQFTSFLYETVFTTLSLFEFFFERRGTTTAQKMKFFKDFFSKCDQIRRFLRILSHLLKKPLMENFRNSIFSLAVLVSPVNLLHIFRIPFLRTPLGMLLFKLQIFIPLPLLLKYISVYLDNVY